MNKRQKSTRQLCGVKEITDNVIVLYNNERLAFFRVTPINVSVLSPENIESKIRSLDNVLTGAENLEICCMDSSECFDSNKLFIKERIEKEPNEAVRSVLRRDLEFLDRIQLETSTAREFVFIARIRTNSDEQMLETINTVEKDIHDNGFEIHRMDKAAMKRMLAIYFEQSAAPDDTADYEIKGDQINA